jgi:hypothetical protein
MRKFEDLPILNFKVEKHLNQHLLKSGFTVATSTKEIFRKAQIFYRPE